MAFANQEANLMKHEYVACEHILLGILKEGGGVASTALKNLNVDFFEVKKRILEKIPLGVNQFNEIKLTLTPRSKIAMEEAMKFSREMNHNYIGTEHLLMGIILEKNSIACQVLSEMKIDLVNVENEIKKILGIEIANSQIKKSKIWTIRLSSGKEKTVIAEDISIALDRAKTYYNDIEGILFKEEVLI
jgi:ATP-dependent Clp protease ATP-binding subunit ClpC